MTFMIYKCYREKWVPKARNSVQYQSSSAKWSVAVPRISSDNCQKKECQMLDKELMETATNMKEGNDFLETLNDDGESESGLTFQLDRMT